jgi:non-heme chloroperoxidase
MSCPPHVAIGTARARIRAILTFTLAAIGPLACFTRGARMPAKPTAEPGLASAVRTVDLPNALTLSYVDLGARGSSAVVLLPGLSDSWRSYELVLPHLSPLTRTIVLSQRGHGDSEKPPTDYRVRDYASDLRAFLDALSVRRAVVVGHSSASLVARRFALNHPDRVAGVVLEGSFVKLGAAVAASVAPTFSALDDPMSREFVQGFVAGTLSRPVPNAFVGAMIDESLKVPARVWRETFAGLLEYDDSAELRRLQPRALIVWGDADAIIDREATAALGRSLPTSEVVVYERVGHTPHWEAPERFARDLSAFAARCFDGG